jgi:Glycosyltransferase family 87
MTEPLLNGRGVRWGAWAGLLAIAADAPALAVNRDSPSLGGLFNDFADYWAAARILGAGGDPYDVRLLAGVLRDAGVHTLVGTGYSYPLLLAELLRPLAALPLPVAGALFTAGGVACLLLAVALLLSPLRCSRREAFALATAAGLFLPVTGSLYMGQVNPYLLPPLALALRGVAAGGGLAAAAAVKLYPAAAALAFASLGRRGLRPLLVTAAATLALALGPNLLAGRWSYGGSLLAMFGPDPFWSNQSLNGWLSRTLPPELPVTPLMVTLAAALGALTAAVAARQREGWPGAFALLLWYGVVAAPKNSLWNFAPLVVVMAYAWTLVRGRAAATALLALAWAAMEAPLLTPAAWLGSVPLTGALLLGGVLAWALLERAAAGAPRHDVVHGTARPGHSRR